MPVKGPIDLNPGAADVPAEGEAPPLDVAPTAWRYTRVQNRGAENQIGKKRNVGPDGFVYLVDYMGGDESVVQAARVSYGLGTKSTRDDRALIRYLMRKHHTTPFEMVEFKFHVRAPMDVWRQWVRHRTASINEYSTRYSLAIDSFAVTRPDEWRLQSEANRQGSGALVGETLGETLSELEAVELADARNFYQSLIGHGVAREQARKHLPLSTYTEAYWKTNLHNLLHFLRLRTDAHAQQEIREFANALADVVYECAPTTWAAFEDYVLGALTLSTHERRVVAAMNSVHDNTAMATVSIMEQVGMWAWAEGTPLRPKANRERVEFEAKLKKLGMANWPWAKYYPERTG